MTLADTAHGSDWILWVVFAVFVILTIALLSGHGSKFISGYNTASKAVSYTHLTLPTICSV